jgi:hypothetical protein
MKPAILVAAILVLGIILSPPLTYAQPRAYINYDFERTCRYANGRLVSRNWAIDDFHLELGGTGFPPPSSVGIAPGRPGHGNALFIDAPLSINDPSPSCREHINGDDPIFLGCGLGGATATFMAHVKPRGEAGILQGGQGFWMNIDAKGFVRAGIWMWRHDGRVVRPLGIRSTFRIPFNQWHHLAFTFTGRRLNLYIDGQLAQTRLAPPARRPWRWTGGSSFGVGQTRKRYANGLIDDVRVFEGALTQRQVQRRMVAPQHPPRSCPLDTTEESPPVVSTEALPPPDPDLITEPAPVPEELFPPPPVEITPIPEEPAPTEPPPEEPVNEEPTAPTDPAPVEESPPVEEPPTEEPAPEGSVPPEPVTPAPADPALEENPYLPLGT